MSEEYLKWHKESGIKVGDKVRVLRQARPKELGWYMQDVSPCHSINGILKVREDQRERGFVLDDGEFYPYFVLEVVESKEERTYKVGDKFKSVLSTYLLVECSRMSEANSYIQLTDMGDGMGYWYPIRVESKYNITQEEFSKICQGDEDEFELIEEE